METRTYRYQPRPIPSLVMIGICIGLATLFADDFLTKPASDPDLYPAIFVTALGAFVLIFSIIDLLRSITRPATLALTGSEIHLPVGFIRRRTIHIPYSTITRVRPWEIDGYQHIGLQTTNGKYSIDRAYLHSQAEFNQILEVLIDRTQCHES